MVQPPKRAGSMSTAAASEIGPEFLSARATAIATAMGHSFAMGYSIPASETKEGQERLRSYYEALGRFVDMFAQVETAITLTLRLYAKTPPEIAKVIFSGTKIDIGSTYIKQLAEATNVKTETYDDLQNVFQQLGIINKARNDIIHYGATSIADGNAVVSNALKAKGEAVEFPISPDVLNDMTSDLRKITFHMNYNHLGRRWPIGALGIDTLTHVLQTPWRYKHPSPPKAKTKKVESQLPRTRGPKQPRPPRSSRS